ncbi:hypothetical protein QFC22_000597 [Naganishia vaughanmartiniae]|uniref:Uncharacterized protein n=1 Tax=Naganishia vaughanmartiniae TaxID=1424756 RepID=A0ACC2XNN8_9TREE|nr:hypothetical protein QFC22_000597 [Naganishia vaughanmartiniae]
MGLPYQEGEENRPWGDLDFSSIPDELFEVCLGQNSLRLHRNARKVVKELGEQQRLHMPSDYGLADTMRIRLENAIMELGSGRTLHWHNMELEKRLKTRAAMRRRRRAVSEAQSLLEIMGAQTGESAPHPPSGLSMTPSSDQPHYLLSTHCQQEDLYLMSPTSSDTVLLQASQPQQGGDGHASSHEQQSTFMSQYQVTSPSTGNVGLTISKGPQQPQSPAVDAYSMGRAGPQDEKWWIDCIDEPPGDDGKPLISKALNLTGV